MQDIVLKSDNRKIFLFDEVYPFRAAQEQAEKKKLNAFGMAKFNPLNRPKEDTVLLQRYERRYEPFWQIEAERSVDYSCQVNYPVHVIIRMRKPYGFSAKTAKWRVKKINRKLKFRFGKVATVN